MQVEHEPGHHDREVIKQKTADTSAAEAALKAKLSRKRTKTGCLTCRKRRIKCGEQRPICSNCIKSKRHCEGYSQRVVFKPPTFEYQPVANGAAHITFQAGPIHVPLPGAVPEHGHDAQQTSLPGGLSSSTHLRSRPVSQQLVTVWDQRIQQYVLISAPNMEHVQNAASDVQIFHPPASSTPIGPGHIAQDPYAPQHQNQLYADLHSAQKLPPSGALDSAIPVARPCLDEHSAYGGPQLINGPAGATTLSATDSMFPMYSCPMPQPLTTHVATSDTSTMLAPDPWTGVSLEAPHGMPMVQTPGSSASSRTLSHSQQNSHTTLQSQWQTDWQMHHCNVHHTQHAQHDPLHNDQPVEYEYHDAPPILDHTHLLHTAAVENQDDGYYDVDSDDSDEEQDVDTSISQDRSHKRQRMLGGVLDGKQISIRGLHMRRYDTFIYEGVLETYRVEYVASPLKNPATARVFAHFISATGPSLSIFERAPISSSVLFNHGTVPVSQQGLWTYTLPMAALHHQGLLHAMLALASLHIARLQGASTTPSMQHYAWALRRIHAAVSNPKSRLKVTTIAASMLLGFYEVMTADHMKWNMHLAGAKQLFVETDFIKMTSECRRMKRERALSLQYESRFGKKKGRDRSEEIFSQANLLDQIPDIDERVVSQMVGKEVRYDSFGHVEASTMNVPPTLDLSKFEILKDLYWWYCKQDVIQSIVSGNPLLMDFSRWANCPPRAPLGRGDAVYGSFDHLVLLLGRIADFASRDRKRKLKQMDANGGQWRPAAGMNILRPPQTPTQSSSFRPPGTVPPMSAPPPMPDFYGMAPPPRAHVQMPHSYASFPHPDVPPPTPPPDAYHRFHNSIDHDLPRATQEALEEHRRIRQALDLFQNSLNTVPSFQPLAPDSYDSLHSTDTAFGPIQFYRTYDIGCLWALYNMAVIIAIRAHPHMPPAAHVAAGVAAPETQGYALEIGRIVAGIVPGPASQALNPSLGAALSESCIASFFAAIQYLDPRQRHETVDRIFSISQRTGWASAELIANGCETAWVKAAAAGRGPPWTRILSRDSSSSNHTHPSSSSSSSTSTKTSTTTKKSSSSDDPRLNRSWEKVDPTVPPPVDGHDGDRRFVRTRSEARLNWAIGLLGLEDD